jgi:class 3 adenylate cyclase
MGKEFDDAFRTMYGLGIPKDSQGTKNSLADLLFNVRQSTIPPPPPAADSSSRMGNLSGLLAPRISIPPIPNYRIPPPPPPSSKTESTPGEIEWCRSIVQGLLKYKATVRDGLVLPATDDLKVMEGRRMRAAFVYSDLHGFTKLVATQAENKSFVFLHTFIEISNRLTKLYKGEVVDVAGDRVLSVFHRPLGDNSREPIEDAVTFALWLQTVFNRVIGPVFTGNGLGQLSLGIGIDYGEVVAGCVGIRNNKRIVFLGDAANLAAKLQDEARAGETVVSSIVGANWPSFLNGNGWTPARENLQGLGPIIRINQFFSADKPPKPRG